MTDYSFAEDDPDAFYDEGMVVYGEEESVSGAGGGLGRIIKSEIADPGYGLTEAELDALGAAVVDDWRRDRDGNKDWREKVETALDAAAQERVPEKNYPFVGASNVRYPLLTVAAQQFAARAYPAIVKGDEAIQVKTFGPDPRGHKQARSERLKAYLNYQLFYVTEDWEADTDALLNMLPLAGCMFRKVYWAQAERRAVDELVSPLRLTVPVDARSLKTSPRVTHDFDRYPYEIEQRVSDGLWRDIEMVPETLDGPDDQAPRIILEQHRICDLGEGSRPYVVTVDEATTKVLRIEDGALDDGGRWMPFVKYAFLPDPKGRFYDIGFGHLLAPLLSVLNTIINQLLDAGHAQIAGGGFISASLRLKGAQGGSLRWQPAEYKVVNSEGGAIRDGIVERTLPAPSPVLFQLLGMVMDAAKDIASVKDVITGDIPHNTQATTVLASIEQGLQVFSSIYKRVFRAGREEYQLFADCLSRYGNPEDYAQINDFMVPDGEPQPGQDGQLQAPPMRQATPEEAAKLFEADFSAGGIDVRPISDPAVVTKQQALGKAQFLLQLMQPLGLNPQAVRRRVLDAAEIGDTDDLEAPVAPQAPPPGALESMAAKLEESSSKSALNRAKAQQTLVDTAQTASDPYEDARQQKPLQPAEVFGLLSQPDPLAVEPMQQVGGQ